MSNPSPKLPRKVLGYDPAAVDEVIAERDSMLSLAERRIRSAEAQVAKLEQQLKAGEEVLAQLQQRESSAADAAAAAKESPQPEEMTQEDVHKELSKVVTTAEASTAQIIQAWSSTRDQIMQADSLWKSVQEEIVRFASWREDVEPIMTMVQRYIAEARQRIDEVPQRVGEALSPAADAMAAVAAGMMEFAKASAMPLLPNPLLQGHVDFDPDGLPEEDDASYEPLGDDEPGLPRSFEQVLEEEGLADAGVEPFAYALPADESAVPSEPESEAEQDPQTVETLEASGW
jgi:DNA polymerase III gamma/tau subunit